MKGIIHYLFRLWIRVTSYFFFEKIIVSGLENLPKECPVIFASNHPNSFLDSIILTTSAKRPLYYTARGDFFKPGIISHLLKFIQILPVFRREEGKENLYKNDKTFSYSLEVLKNNGAIVIFSEGICENEYNLRALRKGTARLANVAWSNPDIGERLKVVPVIIQYSSWLKICPRVYVDFLQNIERKSFPDLEESGLFNKKFNDRLKEILYEKCIVIDKSSDILLQNKFIGFVLRNFNDGVCIAKKMQGKFLLQENKSFNANYVNISEFLVKENIRYFKEGELGFITFLLSILIHASAYILNFIPYHFSRFVVSKITKDAVFHDSLIYVMLMVTYPVYLIIIFSIFNCYLNFCVGNSIVMMALLTAKLYETSKRNVQCFLKRKNLKLVSQMLKNLSETNNG